MSLPQVSSDSGFSFGGRRVAARRLGRVIVFGMLGQHLFGAVQRVWLPNATAVPVQVVRAALVGALAGQVLLVVVLLLRVLARVRSTQAVISTPAAHAPIAVVVVIVVMIVNILPVVAVVMAPTTAAAHLKRGPQRRTHEGRDRDHNGTTQQMQPRQGWRRRAAVWSVYD